MFVRVTTIPTKQLDRVEQNSEYGSYAQNIGPVNLIGYIAQTVSKWHLLQTFKERNVMKGLFFLKNNDTKENLKKTIWIVNVIFWNKYIIEAKCQPITEW